MTGGARGQVVDGRFELLERLGGGGMGTVWRARDVALHRDVALKEVRPPDPLLAPEGSEASRRLRERVLREARALARISHPHVVTVHHIVDAGPYPWIVMELVRGMNLQDRVAIAPLTPQDAARTGLQLLSALRAAHAAGIRHRDVKPANVLLRADGSAVLTDFGIAALQGSSALTATGELIGSPEYIAPERIRGTDDDPASDLWSLGMVLYVCVEGHNPLRRGTSLATLAAVLDEPVPPPVRAGALAPVLTALLVRDPAARPSAERLDSMLAAAAVETAGPAGAVEKTSDAPPAPAAPPVSFPSPGMPAAPPAPPAGPDAPGARRARRAQQVAGAAVAVAALAAGIVYVVNDASGGKKRGPSPSESAKGTPGTGKQGPVSKEFDGRTLTVGMPAGPFPPMELGGAGGEAEGVDPELARALGKRLGARVKFTVAPFTSLLPSLKAKRYDMVIGAMTDTEDRQRDVDFVDYFRAGQSIYTSKGAESIRSWEDLCGKKAAAVQGTSTRDAVTLKSAECASGEIGIHLYSTEAEAQHALSGGSVDAVVSDYASATHAVRTSGSGKDFRMAGEQIAVEPWGIAVSKSDTALRDALKDALDALVKSGEYGKILNKWGVEDGAVTAAELNGGS